MKKIALLILLVSSQIMLAQTKIYTEKEVENKPYFPGGWNEWIGFVRKNMEWTPERKGAQNIQIEFTVQANGEITDTKVINPKPNVNEKEALRVMTLSPKWIPATLKGKKVACRLKYGMFNPWFDNEPALTVAPLHTSNHVTPVIETDENEIYSAAGIEVKPNFPEGFEKFYEFFNNNFKTPEVEDLKGKVYATFIVEKDGTLSDIKILRDIGYGTGRETIRVLNMSPKWNPGIQNGKPVRVMYSLPFSIGGTKTLPEKK